MTRTGDREVCSVSERGREKSEGGWHVRVSLMCLRCCPFHGYLTWNKSKIKPVDRFCQANKKFSLKGLTYKSTVLRGSIVELVRTREYL